MATRFNQVSGHYMSATITETPPYTPLTFMFWGYLLSVVGGNQTMFWFDHLNLQQTLGLVNNKLNMLIQSTSTTGTTAISPNTWYHFAYTCDTSVSSQLAYINGGVELTDTQNFSDTEKYFTVGGGRIGGNLSNMRMQDLFIYNAKLTADEIRTQMQTRRPQRLKNLWNWYPMWPGTRPNDYSFNARAPLTEQATLSDEDPAPVGWGARVQYLVTSSPPSLDQYGFRFRWDDGNEASATWQAAQNANISFARNENFRLRMGINATNDPPSHAYKLQYRKTGTVPWRDVS